MSDYTSSRPARGEEDHPDLPTLERATTHNVETGKKKNRVEPKSWDDKQTLIDQFLSFISE